MLPELGVEVGAVHIEGERQFADVAFASGVLLLEDPALERRQAIIKPASVLGSALKGRGGRGLGRRSGEESGRSQFGAVLYRTTPLFLKLFGLEGLADLPDPARWDPAPGEEDELRERLLKAGDMRAGVQPATPPEAPAPIESAAG